MPSDDKRQFERIPLQRPTQVRRGGRQRGGNLVDISGGGAAVHLDPDEDIEKLLAAVDLDIDGVGAYSGSVVREFEDGIAVRFDLDDDDQDQLISDIMDQSLGLATDD